MKNWRNWIAVLALVTYVIWIRWWASRGFPLDGQICGIQDAPNDCSNYNIIFYSAWALAKTADHWSGLIAAFASIAIAAFTWTLYKSSEKMWEVTKISADAARVSALVARKSLLEANQPILTMSHVELYGPTDKRNFNHITFSFGNAGNGSATIDYFSVTFGFVLFRDGILQERTDIFEDSFNTAVEAHKATPISAMGMPWSDSRDLENFRSGKSTIAVTFAVRAKDVLGTSYEASFPFEYVPERGMFVRRSRESEAAADQEIDESGDS